MEHYPPVDNVSDQQLCFSHEAHNKLQKTLNIVQKYFYGTFMVRFFMSFFAILIPGMEKSSSDILPFTFHRKKGVIQGWNEIWLSK